MKKELKDYLHLYLGCPIVDRKDSYFEVCHAMDASFLSYILQSGRINDFKMVLRPLSDITDMEKKELRMPKDVSKIIWFTAENVRQLTKKSFDLFGLIESGLAIEVKNQQEKI